MNKNKTLAIALAALFTSSLALADSEMSGKLIVERAGFGLQEDASGALKNEARIRLYADGDITDSMTYHVEVQGVNDGTKKGGYSGEYTQNAGLREAYIDMTGGSWDARIGKQQVVWGTADGMKLLDIINPTDYAEMAQDQMEDSRIPVFMLNLEKGPVQLIIAEPKENVFAGLNRGIQTTVNKNATTPSSNGSFADQTFDGTNDDNAFRMMGPDSITGTKNGFLNIVPDLGSVARGFASGFGGIDELSAAGMNGFKVDGFEAMTMGGTAANSMALNMQNFPMGQMVCATDGACTVGNDVANDNYAADSNATQYNYTMLPDNFEANVKNIAASLNNVDPTAVTLAMGNAVTGEQMLAMGFAPPYNTNLANYGTAAKDSVFDYMGDTTFATFNTFVNAKSVYVYDMPDDDSADIALKFSDTTKSGVNYTVVATNSYDKNPHIDLAWYNDANEKLIVEPVDTGMGGTTIKIKDSGGNYYGGLAQETDTTMIPTLRFTQKAAKVKNFGGAFDTSFESPSLGPVVIRGEFLYTTDSKQPVIDVAKLGYGDLVGALQMKDKDSVKFVLGADITVLTNMMISGQYIQDRNLDYVDNADNWTADYATMNMSNNFNKAIKSKNYGSLFLSKPFGASGEHRWNNITMVEEGGAENGYWNRFDVSWGLADDLEGTFEVNNYWGKHDTQFGQLKEASNMQTGIKYSF